MSDTKQKWLWVVIPAINEAATIGQVIKSVPRAIQAGGKVYHTRVVLIDDYSTDDTYQIAKKAGATVLRHSINSGAGAATRTGLRYIMLTKKPADYIITIDADGQHAGEDIAHMLHCAVKNNADVVIGNRLHDGNKKDMPLHRTLGNRVASIISRVLFGIKVEDTQSGLRLFQADTLPILSDYTIDRYGFSTELLWLAHRAGLRICETPIKVRYSKQTLAKGQKNWGAVDVMTDLLWIRISR